MWQAIGELLLIVSLGEEKFCPARKVMQMEHCTLKNVNNCLNTNIYSYSETSGGKNYDLYLNIVHFQHQC
jgi:hypothetical protein